MRNVTPASPYAPSPMRRGACVAGISVTIGNDGSCAACGGVSTMTRIAETEAIFTRSSRPHDSGSLRSAIHLPCSASQRAASICSRLTVPDVSSASVKSLSCDWSTRASAPARRASPYSCLHRSLESCRHVSPRCGMLCSRMARTAGKPDAIASSSIGTTCSQSIGSGPGVSSCSFNGCPPLVCVRPIRGVAMPRNIIGRR